VRELENLIRRLTALYPQETIGLDVIETELAGTGLAELVPNRAESLGEAVERHLRGYFAAHRDGVPSAGLYDRVLREIERPLLQLSLAATRGNQIRAAELLGLNRNTLRKKLRELDIEVVRGVR
jgi:two-component system nitrogen regulation response regulator GlnG